VELTDHPWFVAVQFHPEFKSTPTSPHPLFRDFVKAALDHSNANGTDTRVIEPKEVRKATNSD
jgi:hypothetical protein